jgi:diguanylate cyclase (GGDEF)-like protein
MIAPRYLRYAFPWIAPGGLVVLGAVLITRFAADSVALAWLSAGYPYAVFGAAALLAWRFHRCRVVAAIMAVAIAERLMRHEPVSDSPTVYAAVAFLLPVTLALLSLLKDRGVLTARGLGQLFLVLLQPFAVSLLLESRPQAVARFFGRMLVSPGLAGWTAIPPPAVLAIAGSFAVTLTAAIRRGSPVEKGFLWALIATSLAMTAVPGSAVSTLYFTAAGLILGLSVVEVSYSMAYRDELTGLPARRALPEALAGLGGRYSIAMVDVDRFKKFNDRHGHDVGDEVLRMVASRLKRVSGGGRAFRYGGEEFIVIFAGKSREDILPHLEELRGVIESYAFTVRGRGRPRKKPANGRPKKRRARRKLAVTVSIGVAEHSGVNPTAEDVLKAADKALYRAKRGGRNRVSV